MNDRLEQYLLDSCDDLPTVPAIARRILDAIDDPATSGEDLRRLIERDASLAARVLKVSNSAMYGVSAEISNVMQAISLIGVRAVRNLVMAVAMREVYREFGALEHELWMHGATSAAVAVALARAYAPEVDADAVFTATLLHDIGKTAFANSHREDYAALVKASASEGVTSQRAERERFGFDHAELGARIAEAWNLPPNLVVAIRYHHSEKHWPSLAAEQARLTAVVSLGSDGLRCIGGGGPGQEPTLEFRSLPGWTQLGVGSDEVGAVSDLFRREIAGSEALSG